MISVLDTLLDRTIVGGYSKLGYAFRERVVWDGAPLPDQSGRTVVVTGATSGLGEAAAQGFAELGASVILLVRDVKRGAATAQRLKSATQNAQIDVVACDLADLRSVRRAAAALTEGFAPIHALVNNAGVMPVARTSSADGHELTFATNVLGPFLLTNLLLPELRKVADARVVNVSSGGMYAQKLNVADLLDPPQPFDGTATYARTKRAEVVLTELWAQRETEQSTTVTVHAMHPGWADTAGVQSSLPRFYKLTKPLLRSPQEGADTIVWLGASAARPGPTTISGGFWHDRKTRPTHLVSKTREADAERHALWDACERLTGAVPAAR